MKDTNERMKNETTVREKIFTKLVSDKGLTKIPQTW